MALSWCKVASNIDSHPKIRRAGRAGREVFLFALRRNAETKVPGLIPGIEMEPWFIADQLMMTEGEAAEGLQRAIAAGLLEVQDGAIAIVGWESQWGRRELTADDRAKGGANRTKNAARGPNGAFQPAGHQVSAGESPAVQLDAHQVEPAVTWPAGPGGQLRSEERRVEENRGDQSSGRAERAGTRKPAKKPADERPPHPEHQQGIDAFTVAFQDCRGVAPDWSDNGRSPQLVKDLLYRGGSAVELARRARIMFAHAPAFPATDGGTLKTLAAHWDAFAAPVARQTSLNARGKTPLEAQLERVAMLEERERQEQLGEPP